MSVSNMRTQLVDTLHCVAKGPHRVLLIPVLSLRWETPLDISPPPARTYLLTLFHGGPCGFSPLEYSQRVIPRFNGNAHFCRTRADEPLYL